MYNKSKWIQLLKFDKCHSEGLPEESHDFK